jgi:REP element-mobilizing transposase RayT
MLRGIDKRNIFLAEEEYIAFLQYLEKAQEKVEFTTYAYCLMTNYIHLLLKTEEPIGDIIKRIAVGYAQYHNIKNGRTGHLFQNRFKSDVVETDEYFLMVLRYINQNPVKAGIVQDMKCYNPKFPVKL